MGGMDMLMTIHRSRRTSERGFKSRPVQPYQSGGWRRSFLPVYPARRYVLERTLHAIRGTIKYSIPVIPLKEFNVQEGSYVQWTGNPMDPTLNLTATERVRTSVTLTGQSSPRLVNFDVGIELTQQLENLGLQFTLTAPEDMAMQEELTSKGPEERAKLAVSMLVTGMYLGREAVVAAR